MTNGTQQVMAHGSVSEHHAPLGQPPCATIIFGGVMETKRCFKCGEEKELSVFYAHPQMGDGHLNKCIDCTKLDMRNHRNMNAERIREYDRNRPNKKERIAKSKKYKNKAKAKARSISLRAMKEGRIIKTACHFCGANKRVEMHHPNYGDPLLVYFLCCVCHKKHEAIVRATFREDA